MILELGTKAPDFSAQIDGGKEIKLTDFKGKKLVLYFYPKDQTSGCTTEACDFRDNMERITSSGAVVIGVSPDSVKSHEKFIEKQNLNFHLLSDPDKKICEDYGVWAEKSMYGRKYMGVFRTTYLIDENGIILKSWAKVKVKGHVEDVIGNL